jgi:hypothetical protein
VPLNTKLEGSLQSLFRNFDKLIEESKDLLPPKLDWRQLAFDFEDLCKEGSFSWTHGLQYGWLADRFDCTRLGISVDLPFHARIGTGHHAGYGAVEEDFLLRDAFYLLVKARRTLEKLELAGRKAESEKGSRHFADLLQILNHNVATYARLALFSFYSFVECFVNSVGQDFVSRNPHLSAERKELLSGVRRGRYISLEKKIEMFPTIIRPDRRSPVVLSSRARRAEPFISFFGHVKETRDATAHYAKWKADIWRPPHEWVKSAESGCDTCLEVARRFWNACYPNRLQPAYLGMLDKAKHLQIAESRIKTEEISP